MIFSLNFILWKINKVHPAFYWSLLSRIYSIWSFNLKIIFYCCQPEFQIWNLIEIFESNNFNFKKCFLKCFHNRRVLKSVEDKVGPNIILSKFILIHWLFLENFELEFCWSFKGGDSSKTIFGKDWDLGWIF